MSSPRADHTPTTPLAARLCGPTLASGGSGPRAFRQKADRASSSTLDAVLAVTRSAAAEGRPVARKAHSRHPWLATNDATTPTFASHVHPRTRPSTSRLG